MLYLIMAVGFALNLHYCGTLVTAVKIDIAAKDCMHSTMPGKMNCCKNKQTDIKIKDGHQYHAPSFLSKIFSCEVVDLPFVHHSLSA